MNPLRENGPTRAAPIVTYSLLGACVAVFIAQWSLGPRGGQAAIYSLGLIPEVLFGGARLSAELVTVPPWLTIFTSMFMHGGLGHLAGNMLYLLIFAVNVESRFGHVRFLLFYLACGLAAAMAQAVLDPHSTVPMVGASGAISGVLGAYVLLYPHAQTLVRLPFAHLTRLPTLMLLCLWFALQLVTEWLAPGSAGVAFPAHLGGFVAGVALAPLLRRRAPR